MAIPAFLLSLAIHGRPEGAKDAWPEHPVLVSLTEAIVECFWDPKMGAADRWELTTLDDSANAHLSVKWDSVHIDWEQDGPEFRLVLERDYDLDVRDYESLALRLQSAPDISVDVLATVDDEEKPVIAEARGTIGEQELSGRLRGKHLRRVRLSFTGLAKGPKRVKLRWLMVARPGERWKQPTTEFERFVMSRPAGPFSPGIGILIGPEEIEELQKVTKNPLFASVLSADKALAARHAKIEPQSLVRRFSLYSPARYGRIDEIGIDQNADGLVLALVGLLTENEAYMRRAAAFAVAYASMEYWGEGFVETLPGSTWHASGFAPNNATIRSSLLLDWCWNWLTPEGRKLVRDAIREKGLPRLEKTKHAMANQGVRFNKGLIFGKMALADSFSEPGLRAEIEAHVDLINAQLDPLIRPDGTFSEGLGYGIGTTLSTLATYAAASKVLRKPVAEIAHPKLPKALDFILNHERTLSPLFAAFATGPLGLEEFAGWCVPTSIRESGGYSPVEMSVYGLDWLWAPAHVSRPQPSSPPKFRVYSEGGWVFAGGSNQDEPGISLESGFWDGHGHAWKRKNALTLDGWGEQLLITRHHVSYGDSRFPATSRTAAYNTFTPGGRNQVVPLAKASRMRTPSDEPWFPPQRGAHLSVAKDLGLSAVIESDAATAWEHGVKVARRRVIFLRPDVVIVEDSGVFEESERGVQSWNSFSPWKPDSSQAMASRGANGGVRILSVTPDNVTLTAGEDSVHRVRKPRGFVPVYRAEVSSPRGEKHCLLTVIQAIPPTRFRDPAEVVILDPRRPLLEVIQGRHVARIAGEGYRHNDLWGVRSDGVLTYAVKERGKVVEGGSFGATSIRYEDAEAKGEGFLSISRDDE